MSARKSIAGRIVRGLLAAAGVVVILTAVAIGALRIAAMQLPSYQAQIERALGDALGVKLDFERMDARFGLRGPELTFHSATVAAPDESGPFVAAERAAVVLDAWALAARRELLAKRLTLDGTSLTLLRREDGRLALERTPEGSGAANLALLMPPEVEVAVRDSTVRYVDTRRGVDWTFDDVTLELSRGGGTIELDVRASPPRDVAARLEVAVQGDYRRGGGWRVFGQAADADLGAIGDALPDLRGWPRRGFGDAAVWLDWSEGALTRGMIDAELAELAWTDTGGAALYDRAAFSIEWIRSRTGWRLVMNDVGVDRGGRQWPVGADTVIEVASGRDGPTELTLSSTFLRLEDLSPVVAALDLDPVWASRWLALGPRGDLADLELSWRPGPEGAAYDVSGRFERLGIDPADGVPGFDGLTGELRADSSSGRLNLATEAARLVWPALFRAPLEIDELAGLLVWREGADATRLVGDELVLATPDVRGRSSLEITWPLDDGSPVIDLEAHTEGFDAVAASRYLPAGKMPRKAVDWLDGAIRGGRVSAAHLEFVGPLDAFPFDGGEGVFRVTADVENGLLRYVGDWPAAEALDGTIEFSGAAFRARGSGRVLGNRSDDVRVEIADLRRPVLAVGAETVGPLADVLEFLRSSPPIAARLGPGYERLRAPAGTAGVAFELGLPLLDMTDYRLDATLDIGDGALVVDGFPAGATDVRGMLELSDGVVTAERLDATFLNGPVSASVSPAQAEGYRARLDFDGEVTADAVVEAFGLPLRRSVAGQTRWSGRLLLPSRESVESEAAAGAPLRIAVRSNLSGLALNLPEPFLKEAAEATSLQLDFAIAADRVDAEGNVGANRRFVLAFERGADGFALDRGALAFGGEMPAERADEGLGIYGSVPRLDFDEWAALVRPSTAAERGASLAQSGIGDLFTEARIAIADFTVLGQPLGAARLDVMRDARDWRIAIDSAPVAGLVHVPRGVSRGTVVADLERLHITPGGEGGRADGARTDPRRLLGFELAADEFSFGARRLGSLRAEARAGPRGLELVAFESRSEAFEIAGSGGWLAGPEGPTTRLAFTLRASDVAAALAQLALEPIAAGEMAQITADVWWPGAPSDSWMEHLGGELALRLEDGSLLDIDPGAGRVVGLMSVTALPRRLALDFRDVFNKGFVFDELGGEFRIIDGNAYTDNLKVSGPSAEIGVAGRIGLRDRDYRQQAVVTAEPGNMLPTVGGLIGGPGVGAALLIFTRIFKEPLKGIGRASYCVTGGWDDPVVERLTPEEIEQGRLCADLSAEASAQRGPGEGA